MSKLKRWPLILGFVSIFALVLIIVTLNRKVWHIDYSQEPPGKSFRRAMGQAIPDGVSNLKIAGRAYLWKHWVWMSFSASDEAITKIVTRDRARTASFNGVEARNQLKEKSSSHPKYDQADMELVGWQNVTKIANPEVFLIGHGKEGWLWFANVIVDRKNHKVYVHAWGD